MDKVYEWRVISGIVSPIALIALFSYKICSQKEAVVLLSIS